MNNNTRQNQERIFRELYEKHKGTTMAVSSESLEHKRLRFELISKIIEEDEGFSVHDVGMGLADLYMFLREKYAGKKFSYSGTEIIDEYIEEARRRFPGAEFFNRDLAEEVFPDRYDWVLMSGVFHQRRESSIRDWEKFAENIIKNAFAMSRKGLAFNFISPFVDYYQTEVYYSNMPKIINFVNDELSRFFTIRHDYALFEYTVYVYHEEYIHTKYPQKEFRKYFKCSL
jgi:hypothetical protein